MEHAPGPAPQTWEEYEAAGKPPRRDPWRRPRPEDDMPPKEKMRALFLICLFFMMFGMYQLIKVFAETQPPVSAPVPDGRIVSHECTFSPGVIEAKGEVKNDTGYRFAFEVTLSYRNSEGIDVIDPQRIVTPLLDTNASYRYSLSVGSIARGDISCAATSRPIRK